MFSSAGQIHVRAPGADYEFVALKSMLFELLRPRTELAELSAGACPNRGLFSDKLFHFWTPEFSSTIFPINTVTSFRPLQVGAPDSCLAGPVVGPRIFWLSFVCG